jgi:hypothetical protein
MAKQTFTAGQVLTAAQVNALQANDYNQTVSTKTANYVLVAADAGTRIVMNSAGATTITVNTSLFTAGDTLFLQNIRAGVCTVTAGTATVTTAGSLALAQWSGGTLYFTSASAAIFISSPSPTYTSFTPTFTNFTLGNGAISASYATDGKIVHYTGSVQLGSTSSMGTSPVITLPVTSSMAFALNMGTGTLIDNSPGAYYPAFFYSISGTTIQLACQDSSGTYLAVNFVGSAQPFTWAVNDSFSWNIVYKAA